MNRSRTTRTTRAHRLGLIAMLALGVGHLGGCADLRGAISVFEAENSVSFATIDLTPSEGEDALTARPSLPIGTEAIPIAAVTDYAPLSAPAAPAGGAAIAIVRAVFEEAGFFANFDYISAEAGVLGVREGRFNAVAPLNRTSEREVGFAYSQPIYEDLVLAFFRADRVFAADGVDDFTGKTICRPVDQRFSFLERLIASGNVNLIAPESMSACLRLLLAGQVDVAFALESVMLARVVEMGLQGRIARSRRIFDIVQLRVLFPDETSDDQRLKAQFDKGLADLRASGRYAAFVARSIAASGFTPIAVRLEDRTIIRSVAEDVWGDSMDERDIVASPLGASAAGSFATGLALGLAKQADASSSSAPPGSERASERSNGRSDRSNAGGNGRGNGGGNGNGNGGGNGNGNGGGNGGGKGGGRD